jgi:hypothetical protein
VKGKETKISDQAAKRRRLKKKQRRRLKKMTAAARRRALLADDDKADPNDAGPADIDEFRMELVRRICRFLNTWRACSQRLCQRARACSGKTLACAQNQPRLTPQQQARVNAKMYYALKRAIANAQVRTANEEIGEREGRKR